MLHRILCLVALLAAAAEAGAQAVTEWRTASGLPVAVVEVAGGDVEHLAVFVPTQVELPPTLASFPLVATPRRGGTVAVLTAPAALTATLVVEAGAALSRGAAAVVLVGPTPARELQAALAGLDGAPHLPLPRPACLLAEGGVELRRGTPERVELSLAVPGPDDPRSELLPSLAGWLRGRLEKQFPSIRTDLESSPCPRLVLRAEAGTEHPRVTLGRLRSALGELAVASPAPAEVDKASAAARRGLATVALDGSSTARELAVRLAAGGRAAGALLVAHIDAASLGAIAHHVLAGHPGYAILVEQERRAVAADSQTLENGVVLSWRWVAGETAVAAVAVGGVTPHQGRTALEAAAAAAADRGWAVEVSGIVGVPTVAVVVPAPELDEVLEVLAEAITGVGTAAPATPDEELARSFGLADAVSADSLSVALVLPEEIEEGHEAAVKFFAGLPAGGVRATVLAGPVALGWTRQPGTPRFAAAIELPATVPGLVAGEVLASRIEKVAAATWLVLPGRLFLVISAEGGASVPELDAAAAAALAALRGAASSADTAEAGRRLAAVLFGDVARSAARTAAAPFLPVLPRQEELLAVDAAEVSRVLAGLPPWASLVRRATGPEPVAPTPPAGVRKSPPRRP
jgi:hypothetical protein